MVEVQAINRIKIGAGLADSRAALIFAPPGAAAGSLVALTQFLNEQPGIRAVPGYYGKEGAHVLRVSGLDRESELKKLLERDFPSWQQTQLPPGDTKVQIASDLHFEPLGPNEDYLNYPRLQRFIKERANSFAGLSYMVGNTALIFSARHNWHRMPGKSNTDWFKIYSAIAYNAAAVTLAVLGREAERPQDLHAMMQRIYPRLQKADDDMQTQVQSHTEQTLSFLKRHPWEIAALMNATGAVSHLISAKRRHAVLGREATYEGLAAAGSLVAMAIQGLVPEKQPASVDISRIHDREGCDSALASAETLLAYEHHSGQTRNVMQRLKQWGIENPLMAAAGVSAISNVGYGMAALRSKPVDGSLLLSSGSYLLGNFMKSQAKKRHSVSFDDVVSTAAEILRSDPLLQKENPAALERRIEKFAKALSYEAPVVQPEQKLAQGIRTRLQELPEKSSARGKGTERFLSQEASILQHNPFASREFIHTICQNQGIPGPGI